MKSIKKRLVLQHFAIILLTVMILETLFLLAIRQYYYGSVEQVLTNRVTVSSSFYNRYSQGHSLKNKAKFILENIEKNETALIEVIDIDGTVILDNSGFAPEYKVNAGDFIKAKKGEIGKWKGSDISGERVIAVAAPLRENNTIIGVLRYVASIETIDKIVLKITLLALLIGLIVLGLTLIVSLVMANNIVIPIRELTKIAEKMALGNFNTRAQKRNNDEIGKLADTLNYMAEEIVKAEKIKSDFISSISHELRTPLTSIKGWGETILHDELDNKKEVQEGLEIICKETDRLVGLVENLLDFSKFQSGRIEIEMEKINVSELIKDVKQQFEIRAKEKNIQIMVENNPTNIEIVGNYNRLKQVLINLLDNALKFTQDNGMIMLSAHKAENMAKIIVEDNGIGIGEEDLSKVKEKFYKGNINSPGSGLGLSITNEIIKLHKGEVYIESELDKGTRVTLVIPTILANRDDS